MRALRLTLWPVIAVMVTCVSVVRAEEDAVLAAARKYLKLAADQAKLIENGDYRHETWAMLPGPAEGLKEDAIRSQAQGVLLGAMLTAPLGRDKRECLEYKPGLAAASYALVGDKKGTDR